MKAPKTKLKRALIALARLLRAWDRFGPTTVINLKGGPTSEQEARQVLADLAPANLFSKGWKKILRIPKALSHPKRKTKP